MVLKELYLKNFRNYDSIKITLNPKINIILGNNAQGKTNLLESIYVLCLTKSPRITIENNLIKIGEKQSKIKGIFIENKNKTINEILLLDNSKIYKKNNFEIKKNYDYINDNMNIIYFSPKDLEIIQGSPLERRNYINLEIGQISENYLKVLNDYNKLLKIRNDYLKKMGNNQKIDMNYFNIVTGYLIDKALIICKMRNKFINELNIRTDKIFFSITKLNNFNIEYSTNFDFLNSNCKNIMLNIYQKNLKKDIKNGATLIGPHRDDIIFNLNDKNLKEYGSQGQQRIAILSTKLSEIEIFVKYKNKKPLLLLDDIFSELDNKKKKNIIKYLDDGIQTIITTTDLKNIDKKVYENANIIKIKEGKIIN